MTFRDLLYPYKEDFVWHKFADNAQSQYCAINTLRFWCAIAADGNLDAEPQDYKYVDGYLHITA